GIVTESVVTPSPTLHFAMLKPLQQVPLVFVWQEDEDAPPVQRFRELLLQWKTDGRLWPGQQAEV
ncbi:MAG TPA: LysR family transcriptional regulator, partial [Roseimicrobium sp.]|nr:LysR family transcriptional regulator [Roseimicrobium sp.]